MSTENSTSEVDPPVVEDAGATPVEPLGEAGIAALKSEREARKAAEKAAADAAAKIKEYEDRDKSEQQKQDEALAAARAELAELTVAKTRAEVAAAKNVPASLLHGSTLEELEASAEALIAFRGEAPQTRMVVPDEGKRAPEVSFEEQIEAAMNARNFALVATLKSQQAATSRKE